MEFDALSNRVIGCAIEVHRYLGPGLLESVYETCLTHELEEAGIPFLAQRSLPIRYKGLLLDSAFRVDLLVGGALLVELKAVERIHNIHQAQLLTYMKLPRIRVGLLINFNVPLLRDGLERFIL